MSAGLRVNDVDWTPSGFLVIEIHPINGLGGQPQPKKTKTKRSGLHEAARTNAILIDVIAFRGLDPRQMRFAAPGSITAAAPLQWPQDPLAKWLPDASRAILLAIASARRFSRRRTARASMIWIIAPLATLRYPSSMRGFAPKDRIMDKDRVIGSAKVVKGKVKEATGKAIGDAKLEAEGKADKVEGKVQNVVGGLKETLRGE